MPLLRDGILAGVNALMDPDATLERITLADPGSIECRDACADLFEWIQWGGFEPIWSDQPKASCIFFDLPHHNQPDYA